MKADRTSQVRLYQQVFQYFWVQHWQAYIWSFWYLSLRVHGSLPGIQFKETLECALEKQETARAWPRCSVNIHRLIPLWSCALHNFPARTKELATCPLFSRQLYWGLAICSGMCCTALWDCTSKRKANICLASAVSPFEFIVGGGVENPVWYEDQYRFW